MIANIIFDDVLLLLLFHFNLISKRIISKILMNEDVEGQKIEIII